MTNQVTRRRDVYLEPGVFAGWPANHGTYQWDNEILVGFIRGKYCASAQLHRVSGDLEFVQARSLDYGQAWAIESTWVDEYFEQEHLRPAPSFDLSSAILRVRGSYDHGGDRIASPGGFWLSLDRGRTWDGPYGFDGLEFDPGMQNTSRTCVHAGRLFLSEAKIMHWGSDQIFTARHDGERFFRENVVVPFDGNRAVMPAVATWRGRTYLACRRKGGRRHWIELYSTTDFVTWESHGQIGGTGSNNGNPPALLSTDTHLVCAFGNRSTKNMIAHVYNGETWTKTVLAKSASSDFGYPVLFTGLHGAFICAYYEDVRAGPGKSYACIRSVEFVCDGPGL